MGVAFVDLDRVRVDTEAIVSLPGELCRRRSIVPVKRQDDWLYLALNDPQDLEAREEAGHESGCRIIPVLATKEAIEQTLHRYYPAKTEG